MASSHQPDDLRYIAADYRVRVFLSVDLSGSTAFKNSKLGQTRDNGISPLWVDTFQEFYDSFPARYAVNYQQQRSARSGHDQCPSLWKAVGDELVFCGKISNQVSAVLALNAFIETLAWYREKLASKPFDLNVKGAGWLAAFPEPNRAVQLRREGIDGDQISATEALEKAADLTPFDYDFLGKAIDTGFRVASSAHPERFVLSVQFARLLAGLPDAAGFSPTIRCDQPLQLKGVNGGEPYPMFYIDTLKHLPVSILRENERNLLGTPPPPSRIAIGEYLEIYCQVVGTDEIMLPVDMEAVAIDGPESYKESKSLVQNHLDGERERAEMQAAGAEPAQEGSLHEIEFSPAVEPISKPNVEDS